MSTHENVPKNSLIALVFLPALLVVSAVLLDVREVQSSVELAFTSLSPKGLAVVPASCASNPPNPHTARECDPPAQSYYQGYYQGAYGPGYSQSAYGPGYTQSTYGTYSQSTYSTCSSQNFCSGNNLYHRDANCVDTLITSCQYGCSGSVCNSIPQPAINLQVTPLLVSSGSRVRITWSSANTETCALTENNLHIDDSWTTLNDNKTSSEITEQTVYTLSCVGLDGSHPTMSKTVNVIPVWQER